MRGFAGVFAEWESESGFDLVDLGSLPSRLCPELEADDLDDTPSLSSATGLSLLSSDLAGRIGPSVFVTSSATVDAARAAPVDPVDSANPPAFLPDVVSTLPVPAAPTAAAPVPLPLPPPPTRDGPMRINLRKAYSSAGSSPVSTMLAESAASRTIRANTGLAIASMALLTRKPVWPARRVMSADVPVNSGWRWIVSGTIVAGWVGREGRRVRRGGGEESG